METRWTTIIEGPRRILVPLNVAPGAEKPDLVAALADQVAGVLAALSASVASAANVEAKEAILS
jgi:hypothetical protein